MIKVASVQWNVVFGDADANAEIAIGHLESLARDGVELVAFPECFLTGYCVSSMQEALAIAIPRNHSSLLSLQSACDRLGVLAVVGFAEKTGTGIANSAAIFEPQTPARFYQKSHMPCMGLDRFAEPGNKLEVFDTRLGKIGVLICFDMRPPEASRVLTLAGANIIVLPTNWPVKAETSADHICIARAAENKVFFITCNRVGSENGFSFIGRSKIIDPYGNVLASASDQEQVIIAEIEPSIASDKRNVMIKDVYETEIIASRRPELYSSLTE